MSDAVAVTELLIHYHRNGFPKRKWTVAGRLFQARMWRNHVKDWDKGDQWVEKILKIPRAKCLQRCRVSIYLARRINRTARNLP